MKNKFNFVSVRSAVVPAGRILTDLQGNSARVQLGCFLAADCCLHFCNPRLSNVNSFPKWLNITEQLTHTKVSVFLSYLSNRAQTLNYRIFQQADDSRQWWIKNNFLQEIELCKLVEFSGENACKTLPRYIPVFSQMKDTQIPCTYTETNKWFNRKKDLHWNKVSIYLWVLRISLTDEKLPFGCCPSKRSKQNPQLERERELSNWRWWRKPIHTFGWWWVKIHQPQDCKSRLAMHPRQ